VPYNRLAKMPTRGPDMSRDSLTNREVADYLKVTELSIAWCKGKPPAFKVGNSWRFRREDLEQRISEQSRAIEPTREEE
jgi:hypothetical protein